MIITGQQYGISFDEINANVNWFTDRQDAESDLKDINRWTDIQGAHLVVRDIGPARDIGVASGEPQTFSSRTTSQEWPTEVDVAMKGIAARLQWPSMHWGTEDVHPDAWPHIAAAALDATPVSNS